MQTWKEYLSELFTGCKPGPRHKEEDVPPNPLSDVAGDQNNVSSGSSQNTGIKHNVLRASSEPEALNDTDTDKVLETGSHVNGHQQTGTSSDIGSSSTSQQDNGQQTPQDTTELQVISGIRSQEQLELPADHEAVFDGIKNGMDRPDKSSSHMETDEHVQQNSEKGKSNETQKDSQDRFETETDTGQNAQSTMKESPDATRDPNQSGEHLEHIPSIKPSGPYHSHEPQNNQDPQDNNTLDGMSIIIISGAILSIFIILFVLRIISKKCVAKQVRKNTLDNGILPRLPKVPITIHDFGLDEYIERNGIVDEELISDEEACNEIIIDMNKTLNNGGELKSVTPAPNDNESKFSKLINNAIIEQDVLMDDVVEDLQIAES